MVAIATSESKRIISLRNRVSSASSHAVGPCATGLGSELQGIVYGVTAGDAAVKSTSCWRSC